MQSLQIIQKGRNPCLRNKKRRHRVYVFFSYGRLNRCCTLFRFRSRCKMKLPIKYNPIPNDKAPSRNCSDNEEIGSTEIPNNVSRISLMPNIAKKIGTKTINSANKRICSHSLNINVGIYDSNILYGCLLNSNMCSVIITFIETF